MQIKLLVVVKMFHAIHSQDIHDELMSLKTNKSSIGGV